MGVQSVCGHYLLLNAQLVAQHRAKGQKIGTGFATSRFCFYREVNRGVDWIFTNHALKLCGIRDQLLSHDQIQDRPPQNIMDSR